MCRIPGADCEEKANGMIRNVKSAGEVKSARHQGRLLAAVFGALAVSLLLEFPAYSQAAPPAPVPTGPPVPVAPVFTRVPEDPVGLADLPPPRRFETRHESRIGGDRVRYTATAGETYISNLHGHPIARIFSFSYVKDGPRDPARPVLFVFNGGPGSSSIWLHLGVMGPKRLVLDREVDPSNSPPFGLRDNPDSPLDVADLVFIDPVGTGYSQAIGNAVNADFYGVDEDAESIARFIEAWLTEHGRWNSPKYLMGESYGSVRAAVLPRALMGGPLYTGVMRGITVDGVILLGITLGKIGERVPGMSLPSFAATAFHHGKVDPGGRTIDQFHREAIDFATGEYADALRRLRAGELPDPEKAAVAARLAALTGLPAQSWIEHDLDIPARTFLRSIIADRGLEAGAYDSRYTLPLNPTAGDPVSDDPAMGRYVPGFIAAFHELARDHLQIRMPIPYNSITWASLNFTWNWNRIGQPAGRNYAEELAISMRRTPRMRVLAASGYYDMVTTAAAAEQQISQALPADRVTIRNYESGHMLYLGDTAQSFAEDVRALIAGQF